jgi:hypothetical protein
MEEELPYVGRFFAFRYVGRPPLNLLLILVSLCLGGEIESGDQLLEGQSRMSTKWPAMAAAAAICGLTRWVRPPLP